MNAVKKWMGPMNRVGLAASAAESIGIGIGEPAAARLPDGCPVHLFVCPVFLPPGCLPPPGRMPCRIAAGAALDRETARELCLLEAIERFSLQYSDDDPDQMASTPLPGARHAVLATGLLRLGHPTQRTGGPVADSRGCSVGTDLADAALRGLLELIEHDALTAWWSAEGDFRRVEVGDVDRSLDRLLAWLTARQLALRLIEHRHRSGALAHVCVCTDADGLRPATGSAAGPDPLRTAVRACVEAVVAWFNIAEIERRNTSLAGLPDDVRLEVDLYRGRRALPALPDDVADAAALGAGSPPSDPRSAFRRLAERWGADLAVFDLSRPETAITTARVVRL